MCLCYEVLLMARKVTIGKEVILESALQMLIRDGYSSVNIKTLAAEIGCSTQPIVWHFNNMDGLRNSLYEYAVAYAASSAKSAGGNAVEGFEALGAAYVRMAVNEPNLFKYLYLGEGPSPRTYNVKDIATGPHNDATVKKICEQTGLKRASVLRYIRNTIIYSHGIATLVATGMFTATEKEMMKMINNAADGFLLAEGIDPDRMPKKGKVK